MLHKKLKKPLLALFSSTFLSTIFHRFARGCFKSIQSYMTKKRMARVLNMYTTIIGHLFFSVTLFSIGLQTCILLRNWDI